MRLFFPLLLLSSISTFAADNLLPGGSFEIPQVKVRTVADNGGSPVNAGQPPAWVSFKFRNRDHETKVTGGITNEVARTGSQSLFIDFDHVKAPFQAAILVSNFIPVVSGSDYEVRIWGRTDAKDLISSDGRSAYLKLEVDYFGKDASQSVGEPFLSVQAIPGIKGRDPFYKPDVWRSFDATLTVPPGALFAQVTWRWETGSDPGEINGIMFFDDATMTGAPAANPNMTPAAVQEETPAPGASPVNQ